MENKALDKPRTLWPTLFDRGWMDKFFNTPMDDFFNMGKMMNVPAVNVSETEKEFKLTVGVPGMDKKDFRIEAEEGLLTISATKETEEKEEKKGHYNRREYNYSQWSRSFNLPENCNAAKIEAIYENGELKIMIPKMEINIPRNIKNIPVS